MQPYRYAPGAAVLLLAAVLAGCSSAEGSGEETGLPFRVAVTDRGTISVAIEETGVVEPKRQIVVKSPISGVVRQLHVEAGDAVRVGQRLVTIVPDIAQANALAQLLSEISSSEISVANLRRELDRAQRLAVDTMISEAEVEATRARFDQAENQLRAASDRLRLMQASGVRATDESQSAVVVAPSAGVVILRGVEEGETVVGGTSAFGGGTEMFTIGDLSSLVVKTAINEVDIGKVSFGDIVRLTVDAFPDDTATGVVRLVPPAARQQDRIRVFDVEVEVTGGHRVLRPGMTANVRISGPSREDVVRVPVEAVFFSEGLPTVFKIVDGRATRTGVTLGLSDLSFVEVTEGLVAGDSVALEDPVEAARRAASGR
ncbi:MAG TPA: efflux RND transporter periplasmic adaptor subunit [Gemmatimonadales bacterium]